MVSYWQIREFLKYQINSKTLHGIHSPFVYDLTNKVIRGKKKNSTINPVLELKKKFEESNDQIDYLDFGAGSRKGSQTSKKSLSQIAGISGSGAKKGKLLFSLSAYFRPKTMLELGTSLGFGTAFLELGFPDSKIVTIEGDPKIAQHASNNLERLGLKNSLVECGIFDEVLPRVLNNFPILDLVFFDGNHAKSATLKYFESCLEKASNEALFIFDDIRWSREMLEAWNIICERKEVTVSIDLFDVGLIFFRKEQKKEHFIIRW